MSTDGGYVGSAEYGNFPIGGPIIVAIRYTDNVANWAHFGCIENVSTQLRYRGEYKIREFMMWDRELTDNEIDGIRRFLRVKWNL